MSYNFREVSGTCPKTGEFKVFDVSFPDQRFSSGDSISKNDLNCGADCNVECPIVQRYSAKH